MEGKFAIDWKKMDLDSAKELVKYIMGELESDQRVFNLKPLDVWLSDKDLLERIQERVKKLRINLEEP